MKFKESKLAHKYLDGLKGLEIGGSAHNAFGLDTLNVDYTDDMNTVFKRAEIELCGEAMGVDIVAYGDALPVGDSTQDFVISSHVIEHMFDPIKTLKEWHRVVKNEGVIFTIAPITAHVPGEVRPTTTLKELIDRYTGVITEEGIVQKVRERSEADNNLSSDIIDGILYDTKHGHWTVLDTKLFREICDYLGYELERVDEVDDKVGNGFTTIIRVHK